MPNFDDEWSRTEAEKRISEVLDAAKTGHIQRLQDVDGTFEVRFVKTKVSRTVAEFLSEGSPLKKR